MATTTPNFGWPVPTSTDLVKDGATAIEGLGDAIDASLLDLKGGTTGQVLAKASNTDMDFTWVAQDDSNAIQNAIVDAKGDLIAATAADTPTRLAVGTNGQSLVADSTASTGLKWGYPNAIGCSLYKDNQSIASVSGTILNFQYEMFDTNGFHDNTTNNSRITIPAGLGGKYLVVAQFAYQANANGQRVAYIYTGSGGLYTLSALSPGNATSQATIPLSAIISIAAGDYFELTAFQDSGVSLNVLGGSPYYTRFEVTYLGA
jgi:hypothetical protein